MRPLRLELEGFTSYRDHTVVDFEDADYFVLVGPTGSGKSTVIDAICFALYGSVPRYEHKGLVSPVITQGLLEARVRLDFAIDGDTYTATRVVRRQGGKGATTKEARLEKGEEVLAGNADELTEKVNELIGLSFDHFTRCVVLPQGEFARFLHDKPSDRQDMLVRLLGIDIYERMRVLASGRAAAAKSKLAMIEQRLAEELDEATPEALTEATERVKQLGGLRTRVTEAMPKLESLNASAREARQKVEAAREWIEVLGSLEVPDEIGSLGDAMEHAKKALAEAADVTAGAEASLAAATKARAELPERDPLITAADGHRRMAKAKERFVSEDQLLARSKENHEAAAAVLDAADKQLVAARNEVDEARSLESAAHLAVHLVKGEPCPVCEQPVPDLPKKRAAPALAAAEKNLIKAEKTRAEAEAAATTTREALSRAEASVGVVATDLLELEKELKGHPDPAEVAKLLDAIKAADAAVDKARSDETRSRKEIATAERAIKSLETSERDERRRFLETRDQLIALKPPKALGADLVADWQALVDWGSKKVPTLQQERTQSEALAKKNEAAQKVMLDELGAACADCGVDFDDNLFAAVLDALAEAKQEQKTIAKAIEDAKKLRLQLKETTVHHKLSADLAKHLSANGFEKWIVNEALVRLVEGASLILRELSDEQYSLTIDTAGNFAVTDHHNANETRSAKTLSGGETFLASLSLALSLSDQLMELAAEGSAKLDAIFLDEGFGTLDPETLDTVEASIANLSAGGRMVGVITHVRDLADRIPLQFKVSKELRSSKVEKVNA